MFEDDFPEIDNSQFEKRVLLKNLRWIDYQINSLIDDRKKTLEKISEINKKQGEDEYEAPNLPDSVRFGGMSRDE